jgi:hypothetical protein
MEGEAVDEQISRLVEVVRKELERADFVDGFLMFLQLGGTHTRHTRHTFTYT